MKYVDYNKGGKTSSSLFFDEAPVPVYGPDDVLVEVRAFGVNRADLLQSKGAYPPPAGASDILGLECSGVVREIGENVTAWKAGDEVCGLVDGGAYAEYCSMDGQMIWQKPEGMTWEVAAAIPETYLTAFQALYLLMDATTMERVLIHAAASGVGSAAVQLLQDLDIKKWGTASGAKVNYCLKNGYDAVINYEETSFYQAIMEWTDKTGVDGILDVVGASYFQDNLKALRLDGTLVMLGTLSGVKVNKTNILPIITRRLTIRGSTLRSRKLIYKRRLISRFLDRFGSKIQSGELTPMVYQSFSWREVARAHAMMEQNLNSGKIVLSVQ